MPDPRLTTRYAFVADDGTVHLVRCPACGLANNDICIPIGECAWCDYRVSGATDGTHPAPTKTEVQP